VNPSIIPVLPLTEARTQLFRLAEEVLSGQVDRVCLTHRSHPDGLLLMRASVVSQLERELADLRGRVAPDVRPLAGLGTLLISDDELLADIAFARESHASQAERKEGELASGLRYPQAVGVASRVADTATNDRADDVMATRKAARRRRSR
jgi:hypothetical protein